ncbi:MAG TPA: helix-turn-helix transcriptional regulator [Candidatus Corynebacterium avicola]|uniref:Helix-turn-helix transcriptional regulator n=1 Tax=Candidatus Corynebacterium avicola TaxID=2838527 RepID=A0A9D1RPH4_9CORY|nr:helix-turn-helix transcriptional regulator [Candidatus Corynebacterium avicola]
MTSSVPASGSGSLGEFLKSCRDAISPETASVGTRSSRRRVPGLRREEVAQLAGVSVAYYVRLEQGQAHNASDEVLLALARALQLSSTETEHLLDLANPTRTAPTTRPPAETPNPQSLALLEALGDMPAVLLGRRSDALAWTPTGHALLAPHLPFDTSDPGTRPSLPRLLFLDPQVRETYSDWHAEASSYVSYLRFISAKYPDDARMAELVGELCMKDADFASLWATGKVSACTSGVKHFRHPAVGDLTVNFQLWLQAEEPDHRLEVMTPADQGSAEALDELTRLLGQEQPGASTTT